MAYYGKATPEYYGMRGTESYYNEGLGYLEDRMEDAARKERQLVDLQQLIGTGANVDTTYVGKIPKDIAKAEKKKGISKRAMEIYYTPGGQLIDAMMRDARNLSGEWGAEGASDSWNRMYRSLTEGPIKEIGAAEQVAQRSLGVASQQAEASLQDLSAGRGAARSPMEEREAAKRYHEQFATQRANIATTAGGARAAVLGQASQFMETFSRNYAGNVLKLVQDWTESAPGIRMEYQNMMTQLALGKAQLSGYAMNTAANMEKMLMERELFFSEGDGGGFSVGGAAGGAVGGAATGAMIGSVVPGIGTAVGAVVGGIAGLISGGFS